MRLNSKFKFVYYNYFDILNSSDVCIKFFYSDYEKLEDGTPDKKKNLQNKIKYVSRIYGLFNDYAHNAMDKGESNTLLTRLLLEKRVSVLPLQDEE